MYLKCWGARGSIPVSGPQYIRYGGDTPCMELRDSSGTEIIIDCGTGVRALGNHLLQESVHHIHLLQTHSHWDHIIGFPFFKPLFSSRTEIELYGCPRRQGNIQKLLFDTMRPPHFPIKPDMLSAKLNYHALNSCSFSIGSIQIKTITLNHPNLGLGFRFEEYGRSIVFLTDNELCHAHRGGCNYNEYIHFCRGANILIHDAEYTKVDYRRTKGWGHSRFKDAVRLAIDARVGCLGLFHHNQDRSDDELDILVDDCRKMIAREKVELECVGVYQGMEFFLD